MKRKKLPLTILLIIMCVSCNIDVDTVDSQCSKSPKASKENGVFISEFKPVEVPDKLFTIKGAWVEYVWFNKLNGLRVSKKVTPYTQLCLNLSDFQYGDFNYSSYLSNWIMEVFNGESFGLANGVFEITLSDVKFYKHLKIHLYRIREDRTKLFLKSFVINTEEKEDK